MAQGAMTVVLAFGVLVSQPALMVLDGYGHANAVGMPFGVGCYTRGIAPPHRSSSVHVLAELVHATMRRSDSG